MQSYIRLIIKICCSRTFYNCRYSELKNCLFAEITLHTFYLLYGVWQWKREWAQRKTSFGKTMMLALEMLQWTKSMSWDETNLYSDQLQLQTLLPLVAQSICNVCVITKYLRSTIYHSKIVKFNIYDPNKVLT